jgi:hypothetical protein
MCAGFNKGGTMKTKSARPAAVSRLTKWDDPVYQNAMEKATKRFLDDPWQAHLDRWKMQTEGQIKKVDWFPGMEFANVDFRDFSLDLMISAVLNRESRRKLKKAVKPRHSVVHLHHMTVAYKPSIRQYVYIMALLQEPELKMQVKGWAADRFGQAVLVNGISLNKHPHVTISTRKKTGPVYSNELLKKSTIRPCWEKLVLTGKVVVNRF